MSFKTIIKKDGVKYYSEGYIESKNMILKREILKVIDEVLSEDTARFVKYKKDGFHVMDFDKLEKELKQKIKEFKV